MDNKQYGGWYNNPATGRNQRWFNGTWTNGEDPGGGGSGKSAFDTYNAQLSGEVNKYVDELIGMAKGDYDFAAKWIEANYKQALGSDDAGRQAFLKQVSNTLEEKVGRIAFDYETGSYRVNQDATQATTRTIRNRDLALKRLAEDEELDRRGLLADINEVRETQGASLNERGILSGTREGAQGLAGRQVRDLEQKIGDQLTAFERALGRNEEDITMSAGDQLADISLLQNRSLDDLATGARRGAQDEQQQRDYNLESAGRIRDQRVLQAEQERRKLQNQTKSYADYLARGATGIG